MDSLTHADDPAAADIHAGLLHGLDGIHAVLTGVGADDLGVILGRGVDVMVVSSHAGILELAGLGEAELPEGHADFHAELADFADGAEHLLEFCVTTAHPLPRRTHTEARGPILPRAPRHLQHGVGFHEAAGFDIRGVAGALRAVAAVLGAAAGLDREQGAKLHLVVTPMLQVGVAPALDEVEKRLVVDGLEFGESHG